MEFDDTLKNDGSIKPASNSVTDRMVEAACDEFKMLGQTLDEWLMRAAIEAALREQAPKVGCEGDDGLLRIHSESETCDVCAPMKAQPAPEPVAHRWKAVIDGDRISSWVLTHSEPPPYAVSQEPLYLHPPAHDALREAARMALDALASCEPPGDASFTHRFDVDAVDAAYDALREALGDEKC